MTHALMAENADPATRQEIADRLEPIGHEIRADLDPAYKRATWGTRPEDVEAIKGLTTDMAGRR